LPISRRNEILSLLKEGLEDISFSRPAKDLSWGIPVPNDDTQTMYVWCDALSNYITALGYGGEDNSNFKKYWPADIHVIGKDILRFHTAIWPGMLLSAGLPLPKTVWVHGFVTVGGEKMSKSLGNVVDPFELVKKYGLSGQGVDALRYYLLREIPSGEDGDFTLEKFEERYNADLAKGLGNLVARVLTLAEKSEIELKINSDFETAIKETEKQLEKLLNDFKFNDALSIIWQLIALGNRYVDEKKPWALEADSKEFKEVIGSLLFLISKIGVLIVPFLPETSEKIVKAI
jgi:methionyl-tRNA synthetase